MEQILKTYPAQIPADLIKLMTQGMTYEITLKLTLGKDNCNYAVTDNWVGHLIVTIPFMGDTENFELSALSKDKGRVKSRECYEKLLSALRSSDNFNFSSKVWATKYDEDCSISYPIERIDGEIHFGDRRFSSVFAVKFAEALDKALKAPHPVTIGGWDWQEICTIMPAPRDPLVNIQVYKVTGSERVEYTGGPILQPDEGFFDYLEIHDPEVERVYKSEWIRGVKVVEAGKERARGSSGSILKFKLDYEKKFSLKNCMVPVTHL